MLFLSFYLAERLYTQSTYCSTSAAYPNALSNISSTNFSSGKEEVFIVRVFVHVVSNSAGTNGVTQNQINLALDRLTADFNPHGICISLLGIDYIKNDDFMYWYDACPGAPAQNTNDDNDFDQLMAVNFKSNAINIYAMPDNIFYGGRANGIPGNAFVIGGSPSFNGIVSILFTSPVISHEMGHCLGLFHTFHGSSVENNSGPDCDGSINTNLCSELVNGSNSLICGDFVQDTPADPVKLYTYIFTDCIWNCPVTLVDINGDLYDPDEHLIMSYTYPQCMAYFTADQGQRMRDHLSTQAILQPVILQDHIFVQNVSYNDNEVLYASRLSITAGANVTNQTTSGLVSILDYSESVFKAGSSIDLLPGFEARPKIAKSAPDGYFIANIVPVCNEIDQPNSAKLVEESIYHPMLNNSNWIVLSQGFEGNTGTQIKFDKDTTMDGQTYHKYNQIDYAPLNTNIGVSGDDFPAYLREDLATKRVYKKSPMFSEFILYDFNLEIGDTMPCYSNYLLTVIDSVEVAIGWRKRYVFTIQTGPSVTWIESIGSLSNPVIPAAGHPILLCALQDSNVFYDIGDNYGINCDEIVSSSPSLETTIINNNFEIRKSGNDLFIVSDIEGVLQVTIHNLAGAKVLEKSLNGNRIIQTAELNSGFYILSIKYNEIVNNYKIFIN